MSNLKDNNNFTKEDRKYMEIAIKLAGRGKGDAKPNPMVGAIIVKDGKIISSGYHRQAGLHHAEIEAINNSTQSLESSTMYVTLEPCTFQGKTPPCVNEIVKHKLKEIIIGCIDP
ncbi:MAG: bifunctional diaminohydroxyphosphoribosylaminopyrimidine deaminase/5-amino-6-(5-phosphoribosylamino)uracil reductase RibD, partial [Actinobacteria bacterium]|nr:bifunctional diaminohydroxyphosphoribosylaminopyrimidine deaminase/5-amino-6-(5-phosphoribosylamino)uracil reductase RibD [Actinomycetota bacterium]